MHVCMCVYVYVCFGGAVGTGRRKQGGREWQEDGRYGERVSRAPLGVGKSVILGTLAHVVGGMVPFQGGMGQADGEVLNRGKT